MTKPNSKIVLIHGYGTGLDGVFMKPEAIDNGGFLVMQDKIDQGQAILYDWRINKKLSVIDSLNPIENIKLYQDEVKLAMSKHNLLRLYNFLDLYNPSIIICHSLGCRMLLSHIELYPLNSNLERIILMQGDFNSNRDIPESLIKKPNIALENYYCYWDQALLSSGIINHYLRAGQVGWHPKNQTGIKNRIQNKFFPLIKPPNLHSACIRDKRLFDKLVRL